MPSVSGKNYDWRGLNNEEYALVNRKWCELVEFFISKLPPSLVENKNSSILYVGCAYGALQKVWIDKGYNNIEGIEWAEERAEIARQYNCHVTVADYRKLPMFKDRQFRLVIIDRVLSHTDQINYKGPQDFSELFRVCDDRAAIFILFHWKWGLRNIKQFFGLGWNVHWGIYRNQLLHVTLFRGCELPARSNQSRIRWFLFRT
ncbi:MAG: class I SAM-dependent methyltransferase, partial [Planctomycetota bacterium]